MTSFEAMNIALKNIEKVNSRPVDLQNEVDKLRADVKLLNKFVSAILDTIPKEQLEEIKIIVNAKVSFEAK